MNKRRTVLKTLGSGLLLQLLPIGAQAGIARFVDVRLWPADDYTRVTLEHNGALKFRHFLVESPHRMVVDILDMQMDRSLKSLAERVNPNDPYVQQIRVGQFDAQTVRIVFDLKVPVKPEVFTIDPVAEYKNRLVVDFYPAKPHDPLIALLKDEESNSKGGDWSASGAKRREEELNRAKALADQELGSSSDDELAKPSGKGDKKVDTSESKEKNKPSAKHAESTRGNSGSEKLSDKSSDKFSEKSLEKPSDSSGPKVRRLVTVAIDPGHGGEDPGAVGPQGTYEKDVVLQIAKLLKKEIDQMPGMRAMLTRNDDYFVPLGKRVQKARGVKADLFVSVHADGFIKPSARGSSVFVLSEGGASSSAARWLADKQNASDLIGGVNISEKDNQLAKVLLDLSTTAQISDSMKLGGAVLGRLGNINTLHKASVEQAGFAVLKAPDIPSILVETAFISNPLEEQKLIDPKHQLKIAKAIAGGVREYFDKNPPVARSNVA